MRRLCSFHGLFVLKKEFTFFRLKNLLEFINNKGLWRNWLARLDGIEEVRGSTPLRSTILN